MSLAAVEKLLTDAYTAAIGGSLTTAYARTAWPNKKLNHGGASAPWYCLEFMPNVPDVVTLGGSAGQDRGTGLLQIDVNLPLDTGDKAARDFGDLLRSYFTAGRGFRQGSVVVTINRFGQSGPGRVVDGYFRVSFVAVWRSTMPR